VLPSGDRSILPLGKATVKAGFDVGYKP
jgi:hypothetical protein